MVGLRIIPLLLFCLMAVNAQAEKIMNLSIPAPDQLGMGNVLNGDSGSTIVWNGPRIESPADIAEAPAAPLAIEPARRLAAMPLAPNATTVQDNALFGHHGIVSSDTSAFIKWNEVVAREQQELRGPHNPETTAWLAFLETLRGLSRRDQLAAVNAYANRVTYIADAENYGQNDHWATTGEFLTRGGDCEDYAITKYMSLQMLGFDTNQMRVVILFDQEKQVRHAVLAVDDGAGVEILDNQSRSVVAAIDIDHYQPIYAISQTGWWRYV